MEFPPCDIILNKYEKKRYTADMKIEWKLQCVSAHVSSTNRVNNHHANSPSRKKKNKKGFAND